jgi:hypothetical protein
MVSGALPDQRGHRQFFMNSRDGFFQNNAIEAIETLLKLLIVGEFGVTKTYIGRFLLPWMPELESRPELMAGCEDRLPATGGLPG